MNFKDLTEPECGGSNPLMRLGQQLTQPLLRDEGTSNFRDSGFQPAESVRIPKTMTFETFCDDNNPLMISDIPNGCAVERDARNG